MARAAAIAACKAETTVTSRVISARSISRPANGPSRTTGSRPATISADTGESGVGLVVDLQRQHDQGRVVPARADSAHPGGHDEIAAGAFRLWTSLWNHARQYGHGRGMTAAGRRALILGGTGQVGSAAARRLAACGWRVVLAARGRRPLPPDLARRGVRLAVLNPDQAGRPGGGGRERGRPPG